MILNKIHRAAVIRVQLIAATALLICGSAVSISAQEKDNDVTTVKTRVVFVDALVQNQKTKEPINNLTREDFTVTDNGRARDLTYFGTETTARRPRALMLVIDLYSYWSGVLHDKETVRRLAAALSKLPPEDEVAVAATWLGKTASPCMPIGPNSSLYPQPVQMLQNFTRERAKIVDALGLVPELFAKILRDTPLRTFDIGVEDAVPGITCVAETLHRAAEESPNTQTVMFVFSDDNEPFPSFVRDEMFHKMLEVGITVNLLQGKKDFLTQLIFYPLNKAVYRELPVVYNVITDIAQRTGGEKLRAGGGKKYAAAFEKLINNLTARYALGFTLDENEQDANQLHKLEVTVKARDARGKERKVLVNARAGYYLPKE